MSDVFALPVLSHSLCTLDPALSHMLSSTRFGGVGCTCYGSQGQESEPGRVDSSLRFSRVLGLSLTRRVRIAETPQVMRISGWLVASSKTTEIRVNSSNLCRETETWSIGQIPVTGSRNDFRSSFPNNKLRPGRLFTVKVFPEMIPVNSFSGTNNAQP